MTPGTGVRVKYTVTEIHNLATGGQIALLSPTYDATASSKSLAPNVQPIALPLDNPEAVTMFQLGSTCWGQFTPAN